MHLIHSSGHYRFFRDSLVQKILKVFSLPKKYVYYHPN